MESMEHYGRCSRRQSRFYTRGRANATLTNARVPSFTETAVSGIHELSLEPRPPTVGGSEKSRLLFLYSEPITLLVQRTRSSRSAMFALQAAVAKGAASSLAPSSRIVQRLSGFSISSLCRKAKPRMTWLVWGADAI
jgi:hypothetical protein